MGSTVIPRDSERLFIVFGLVAWPTNGTDSATDPVWIQTSMLFSCK